VSLAVEQVMPCREHPDGGGGVAVSEWAALARDPLERASAGDHDQLARRGRCAARVLDQHLDRIVAQRSQVQRPGGVAASATPST
jgi:hypothetical protein